MYAERTRSDSLHSDISSRGSLESRRSSGGSCSPYLTSYAPGSNSPSLIGGASATEEILWDILSVFYSNVSFTDDPSDTADVSEKCKIFFEKILKQIDEHGVQRLLALLANNPSNFAYLSGALLDVLLQHLESGKLSEALLNNILANFKKLIHEPGFGPSGIVDTIIKSYDSLLERKPNTEITLKEKLLEKLAIVLITDAQSSDKLVTAAAGKISYIHMAKLAVMASQPEKLKLLIKKFPAKDKLSFSRALLDHARKHKRRDVLSLLLEDEQLVEIIPERELKQIKAAISRPPRKPGIR